ncbi:MAG: HEPN domain-containing protein [Rhodocyclaceae bacterium]|jgi:HEPN domain-containing protein|nr:HEPN domain-containing protein [Rhodocyclaceae bacterium]
MNPHEEQAWALIDAAERDGKTFRILVRDPESPIETTLFHAQQALEKSLKAALVSKGVIFPRTHDLLELFDLAAGNGLLAPATRDIMARLGPYAVEFRYLGVIAPEVSRDEAAAAVEACLDWVKGFLK